MDADAVCSPFDHRFVTQRGGASTNVHFLRAPSRGTMDR
jgi:hypothetical protein